MLYGICIMMNLTQTSCIRTNKQGVVNIGKLTKEIVDFRKEYTDTYRVVIEKNGRVSKEVDNRSILENNKDCSNFAAILLCVLDKKSETIQKFLKKM